MPSYLITPYSSIYLSLYHIYQAAHEPAKMGFDHTFLMLNIRAMFLHIHMTDQPAWMQL